MSSPSVVTVRFRGIRSKGIRFSGVLSTGSHSETAKATRDPLGGIRFKGFRFNSMQSLWAGKQFSSVQRRFFFL